MTNIMITSMLISTIGAVAMIPPPPLVSTTTDVVETSYTDEQITNYIPQYNCGYSNVNFDTSLNTFQPNDTIWFYYGDDTSNCEQPNSGTPCKGSMLMTGNYGNYFGYLPYSVWYDFSNFGKDGDDYWVVTLRYNYNGGQTSITDVIPCDGFEYVTQLTRCMFDEQLYNFEFFKYYQFFFYTTCTYNFETQLVNFNLDQESRTCTGTDGNVNINRFNLAGFSDWYPFTSVIGSDENAFCPDCRPTTTVEPPATTTPCETSTTEPVPVPTEPVPKPCRSCGNGDITISVQVN